MWAGISKRGSTGICIFDGIMDRFLYMDIILSSHLYARYIQMAVVL